MGVVVFDGDVFGVFGGFGGIDDVGEVVGVDFVCGQCQVVCLVVVFFQCQVWLVQCGDLFVGVCVDQYQQVVGVVEYVGYLFFWIGWVQWDVVIVGVEYVKQVDQQVVVVLQVDFDLLFWSYFGGVQVYGECGVFVFQFGIVEVMVGGVYGDVLWCVLCLGFEQMVEYVV